MLTPQTEHVWNSIREDETRLRGFVLIGGTALALQINHRISEDLDFAFGGAKLPRRQIDHILNHLRDKGVSITSNDNPAALDEAANAGEDLHDFHQDYIANAKVKLTFVSPSQDVNRVLNTTPSSPFRIATVAEIFNLKCLVTARREKSRDWFDLYILFTQHGYTVANVYEAFAAVGQEASTQVALNRLCSCKRNPYDEGYEQLVKNPPSLTDMAAYFTVERRKYEVSLAQQTFRAVNRTKTPLL